MRCKQCDHSLWNQPAPREGEPRVCSECGAPYAPSEFDFVPGRVRFCCPSCDTAYYGTSPRGHLEPAEFDCVKCGAHVTMDACILRPERVEFEREAMQARVIPWLETGKAGWLSKWWGTTALGLTNAGRVSSMLNGPPRMMPAALFVLVNAALVTSLTVGASFIFGVGFAMTAGGAGGVPGFGSLALFLRGLAVFAVSTLALVVYPALPAAFCCLLTRKGERLGFARAYEVAAYSSGAIIVSLIPCCGPLIGGVWWLVQVVQGFVGAFAGEPAVTRIAAGILSFVGFISAIVAFIAVSVLL